MTPSDRDSLANLDRFLREDWEAEGWEQRLRNLAQAYRRCVFSSSELKVSYREHMTDRKEIPVVVEHRVPEDAAGDELVGLSAPSEFWTWGKELALLLHPIFKRLSPEEPLTSYNGPLLFPQVPDVVLLVAGELEGFGNPTADDMVESIGAIWESAADDLARNRDKRPRIIKLYAHQVSTERVRAAIEDPFTELENSDHPLTRKRDLVGLIHWVGRSELGREQSQVVQIPGGGESELHHLSPKNLAITLASARNRKIRWQFFFLCCYRDSGEQEPIPAPGYSQVLEPLVLHGGVPCALGLTRPVSRECARDLVNEFYYQLLMPYRDDDPAGPVPGVPEAIFGTRKRLYQDFKQGSESCYYGWASPTLIMQRSQRARRPPVDTDSQAEVRVEDRRFIADRIRRGQCCSVVAPPHMGKSFLLRSLLTEQVLWSCASGEEGPPLAVFVDCLAVADEPAFYGLLLHEIIVQLQETDASQSTVDGLVTSYNDVLRAHNARAAWAYFNMGIGKLCRETSFRILLLLDEFDEAFSKLPPRPFKQLRMLYEQFEPRLCYVTATSRPLENIRAEDTMRYFRELFSRYTLLLRPLPEGQSEQVLAHLAEERGAVLDRGQRSRMVDLSGGHPGLLERIYDLAEFDPALLDRATAAELSETAGIRDECQTLWDALEKEQQEGLRTLLADGEVGLGATQRRTLWDKRLIIKEKTGALAVFSPLFEAFIRRDSKTGVVHDPHTGRIFVDGRDVTEALDPQPRELVRLLWQKRGDVCTHEEIRAALWRDEGHGGSRNVYIVVQRARDVIEPDPDEPTYILNVWGRGYRLHLPNQG
jgi:hypothetical protein